MVVGVDLILHAKTSTMLSYGVKYNMAVTEVLWYLFRLENGINYIQQFSLLVKYSDTLV